MTTKLNFTDRERKKIAAVLAAQVAKFEAGIGTSGYNNTDGGCPNCGDTGGFHDLIYQLRQTFGIKK